MDAKERLRRYLEQRRELGESELVLDALPVDDVLRMIGAPSVASTKLAAKSGSANDARDATTRTETHATPLAQPPQVPDISAEIAPPAVVPENPPPRFDATAPTDWRTALRNAEASIPVAERALPTSPKTGAAPNDNAAPKSASAAITSGVPYTTMPLWLSALGIPPGLTAAPLGNASSKHAAHSLGSLEELATMIAACRACSLGASATNPVPGEGNANADLVCVGEAPGQTEDETGRPFVGAAGQLLTKILAAIQLQREDVFICNVLKHRPPGNRNPSPDEVTACTPYLTRQLELIKPKVILALGTFAAQTLLNTQTSLGKLRGQVHSYQNIPLIVTYHPAALLRNESWKRPAWDDVRLARRILDAARAASPSAF